MRKSNSKHPMAEERMTSSYSFSKRHFNSMHDSLQIPTFTTVDDEEYFFEVEDV